MFTLIFKSITYLFSPSYELLNPHFLIVYLCNSFTECYFHNCFSLFPVFHSLKNIHLILSISIEICPSFVPCQKLERHIFIHRKHCHMKDSVCGTDMQRTHSVGWSTMNPHSCIACVLWRLIRSFVSVKILYFLYCSHHLQLSSISRPSFYS